MTLSSRHRIRNSSPDGLRPSTLPLGHGGSPQYWLSHVDGEETVFVSFKPPRPGTEPRTLAWKAAVLTTILGPPPIIQLNVNHLLTDQRWLKTDLFYTKYWNIPILEYIVNQIILLKNVSVFYCNAKRQYLLTCKVKGRYCVLDLHGSAV